MIILDNNEPLLPTLSLDKLVDVELENIQKQRMSNQKVVEFYELYKKLDFVERLGVLPKEQVVEQKRRVMGSLENSIITEYSK